MSNQYWGGGYRLVQEQEGRSAEWGNVCKSVRLWACTMHQCPQLLGTRRVNKMMAV